MKKVSVSAARSVAVQVLGEVRRREARARDLLRSSERVEALDERDRAHAMRIVMGVVGTAGLLDKAIDRRVRARSGVEPKVRDALRVAAYELLFLSTPPSAAVSQGVELVRGARPRAAGMANAVLRRIAEEDVSQRNEALDRVGAGGDHVEDLAWVSGYPTWLLARVGADRGNDAARAFALSASEPAPVYVAPNLARIRYDEALETLVAHDLSPVATDLPGSYELRRPARLARSGLVQNVKMVPADLSSQHVAALVVPEGDGRILEVGQGRGTKSVLLQNAARRKGCALQITGVDSEAYKTKVARRRMRSAGLEDCVRCVTFDARKLGDSTAADALGTNEPFDVVFVDAPCSGTGTIRRHPEIAWSLAREDVDALSELQLAMLCAAATWVRPGGKLCYATCSVLRQENEGVVDAFLESPVGASFVLMDKPFSTLPTLAGPDGHFCACLKRMGERAKPQE